MGNKKSRKRKISRALRCMHMIAEHFEMEPDWEKKTREQILKRPRKPRPKRKNKSSHPLEFFPEDDEDYSGPSW